MNETITITLKHYQELMDDAAFLNCLRNSGVDNWEGYEIAQDAFAEDNE